MKHIIKLFVVLIVTASCKAQQPMYDNPDYGDEDGVYYKDMDNDFNRFEGIWLYTNGNTSLEVHLVKKENMYINDLGDNFYTDAIVGEYRYIENGVTIANTLFNINANYTHPYDYTITGDNIKRYGDLLCAGCGPDEVQIHCNFTDPSPFETEVLDTRFNMRHFMDNGVEKLEIYYTGSTSLTHGYYILTKQ